MSLEDWFWVAHAISLVGWLALIFRRDAASVRFARWAAAVLAVGYVLLFLLSWRQAAVLARDYSLGGVASFFSVKELILLGWVHILAFDLLAGSWETEEAERVGLSRAALIPSLILTFMLGPIGLLLFLAMRARASTR